MTTVSHVISLSFPKTRVAYLVGASALVARAARRGGRRVADLTSSSVIGVDFGGGLMASFAISPDLKSEDRLVTRLVLLSCLSSP